MKKYLTFFLISSFLNTLQAQFLSAEPLESYSIEEMNVIAANLGIPTIFINPEYEVELYRITYETPDSHGNMTTATGALCVPISDCDFPFASYQHGTVALKTAVPSFFSGELNVGLLLATTGYIVCLPDYLGLGGSPGLHPYVHAKTEATASIDMVRASRFYADLEGFAYNNQLMLLGYSQGGHSTMAMHKELQENHPDIEVTASFPLSGPYDVSGVQTDVIVGDDPYPTPGYLPYILFAYNEVYGNLFNDPSEIFVPPYDEILPPLFDGQHSMGEINAQCPSIPKLVLKPEVVDSFINDANHRFWFPLKDNDLYDWVPQAPVHMYYCEGDDQVNYMNSVVALDAFEANNAPDVKATNLGSGDHGECFSPAILATKNQMDNFRAACTTSTTSLEKDLPIKIFPNPNNGYFSIDIPSIEGIERLELYNSKGQLIHRFENIQIGQYEFHQSEIPPGLYFIAGIGKSPFRMKMVIL